MSRLADLATVTITMNRVHELSRTLSRLTALPEQPRIVVVDNGSTDGTAAMVERDHQNVELIRLPTNLGAIARNIGVEHANTRYVAFLDDDTWPQPGALRCAVEILGAHPSVAIISGHVLVGSEERDDATCAAMACSEVRKPERMPGCAVVGFMAGASVVRTAAFRAAGGFQRCDGIGGEEELLAWDLIDAGWTILYVPEVVVHHHPSRLRDADLRVRWETRNRIRVAWLRRSWPDVVAITADELRRCPTTRRRLETLVDCARMLPLLRERRPVSRETERIIRGVSIDRSAPPERLRGGGVALEQTDVDGTRPAADLPGRRAGCGQDPRDDRRRDPSRRPWR